MSPKKAAAPTILTPAAQPRPRFPWAALWGLVLTALGTLVIALRPSGAAAAVDVGLKVIGVASGWAIAKWAEERLYSAFAGRNAVLRLLVGFAVPVLAGAAAIFGAPLLRHAFAPLGDRSTVALVVFATFAWMASAGVGSLLVLLMDYAISVVVPDLRTRIVAAVLTLLALVAGTTLAMSRLLPWIAADAVADPQSWKARLTQVALAPDEVQRLLTLHQERVALDPEVRRLLDVPDEYSVLRTEELERLVGWGSGASGSLALVLFALAAMLGVPAVLSASSKLAGAIMERLHPLARAFSLVARGRLDIRVEEGGSADFVTLSRHFNQMVQSLSDAQRLERAFGLYVSEHVRDRILGQHGEAILPASLREATVLFADIRGFTSMSERTTPADVLEVLNRYFEGVVPIVEQYEGYLDKFVGDAMMVVFNAPLDQPDHASRAVRCAIALQEELALLNRQGEFGDFGNLQIGVGVATGPLVAGNLGSARKMEYTVVGDTVNLASRLTSHAGAGEVWVNDACARELPDDVPRTAVGAVQIKGKALPVFPYIVWPQENPTEKVQAVS